MRLVLLWVLVSFSVAEAENQPNWSAGYPPCDRHSELLKHGHMDLGVRLATANPVLAEQFRRAMDSWARILDLDWHDDDTQNCSIQLVDGDRELSDLPLWPGHSCLTGSISRGGSRSTRRRRSARPTCTGYRYTRLAICSGCNITRAWAR